MSCWLHGEPRQACSLQLTSCSWTETKLCCWCRPVLDCRGSLEGTLRLAQCTAVSATEAPEALLDHLHQLSEQHRDEDAPGEHCIKNWQDLG